LDGHLVPLQARHLGHAHEIHHHPAAHRQNAAAGLLDFPAIAAMLPYAINSVTITGPEAV
jgi:hypothetical protein